jgi:hypothetical protein
MPQALLTLLIWASQPQSVPINRPLSLQKEVKAVFASLARSARDAIIRRRAAAYGVGLDQASLEAVISAERVNELAATQWTRRPGGDSLSLTAACLDAFKVSARILGLKLQNDDAGAKVAADYYFNVAFMNWGLFLRKERRFVIIRDYPFFRRVVAGGEEWMEELCARVYLRGGNDYPLIWDGGEQRYDNYLRHVEAYALSYWEMGRDVDYSGPEVVSHQASWYRKRAFS